MLILYVWQAIEDASGLNKPGFWIWYVCICKGYAEFGVCLIMPPFATIMPEHASMYLNAPQFAWTWLDIAEYLWMCLKMLESTTLCQGSQCVAINF